MQQLTDHIVEGDSTNHQLTVEVMDEPGQGGACHEYRIRDFYNKVHHWDNVLIFFQNGPIKDVGVNGVTHEALLAILLHRMRSFQSGPYANEHNHFALEHMEAALNHLQARTRERIARNVEGTHAV